MSSREPTRKPAGRVPRNTLSRDRIVDAALALIDDDGLDALTMPRLAERLGVGTMSLYRHIADKDDLVNAVAARVLSGVGVPEGDPDDWRGRVVGYLRVLREQTLAHPALSRILADRGLTVGPVFDQLEQAHTILLAAGFSPTDAVRTFYALLTYVFGFVMWELPRVHQQPAAAYTAAWATALDRLDPDRYPTLHALHDSCPPLPRRTSSSTGSTTSSRHSTTAQLPRPQPLDLRAVAPPSGVDGCVVRRRPNRRWSMVTAANIMSMTGGSLQTRTAVVDGRLISHDGQADFDSNPEHHGALKCAGRSRWRPRRRR